MLGGWADKYKTIDAWKTDCDKHQLGAAWEKCRTVFIAGANEGEFGHRVRQAKQGRGYTAAKLETRLQEMHGTITKLLEHRRQKVVRTRGKYYIQTVRRYTDTHSGRTPEQDGLQPKERQVKGKLRMTVVVDRQPEGQWEMDTDDEEAIGVTSALDDGALLLDDAQQERKFDAWVTENVDAAVAGCGRVADPTEEVERNRAGEPSVLDEAEEELDESEPDLLMQPLRPRSMMLQSQAQLHITRFGMPSFFIFHLHILFHLHIIFNFSFAIIYNSSFQQRNQGWVLRQDKSIF
jgi:hypothetical protein